MGSAGLRHLPLLPLCALPYPQPPATGRPPASQSTRELGLEDLATKRNQPRVGERQEGPLGRGNQPDTPAHPLKSPRSQMGLAGGDVLGALTARTKEVTYSVASSSAAPKGQRGILTRYSPFSAATSLRAGDTIRMSHIFHPPATHPPSILWDEMPASPKPPSLPQPLLWAT